MSVFGQVELGYIELSRKILQEACQKKLSINSTFPSLKKIEDKFNVRPKLIELAFKELIKNDYCYSLNGSDMHLKKIPEDLGRSSFTYGIVLGYHRLDEDLLPFYKNLYTSAERKIIEENDNLLCLQDWTKKSIVRKKQELAQFTSHVTGYIGIGLFNDKDCLLLRSSGVSSVVVDLDSTAFGLDCAVFDNSSIMGKLVDSVLAKVPEAVFYIDFDRSSDYDPAVEERKNAFTSKYTKYIKGKENVSSSILGIHRNVIKGLSPLQDYIKKALGRVHIICADDTVALNVCEMLEGVDVVPGKDFDLAYIGPEQPRIELQKYPATIGVLNEKGLSEAGFDLLKSRIKKGRGKVVIEKISGGTLTWNPVV